MNLEPLAAIVEMKGEDLVLSRKCRVTDELVTLTIKFKDYRRWKLKEDLIQNIFPKLTLDEREFIQTGYTKAEWAKLFPPEEDEVGQSGHPSIATSDPDAPGVITAEELAREYREEAIAEGHIPPEELRGSDLDALAEEQKAHDAYMERMEMRRPQSERDLEQDLLNRRRPFA